jgi:hypothetical protein
MQPTGDAGDAFAEEAVLEGFAGSAVATGVALAGRRRHLAAVAAATLGTLAVGAELAIGAETPGLTWIGVAKRNLVLAQIA